jgi:hypothetical protein
MTDGHIFQKDFRRLCEIPTLSDFAFVRFVKKELDDPFKFQKTYPNFGICNFSGVSGVCGH